MKKLIGILGVVAIVMSMFFNANLSNKSEIDLTDLISISTANAEDSDWFSEGSTEDCVYIGEGPLIVCCGGFIIDNPIPVNGTKTVCELAWTWATCYNTDCS